MLTVNVNQVKTNLSYYLDLVQKGKNIVIAKRNIPIAQLLPLDKKVATRMIGQCEEKFEIPDSFFDPLPKELINSFNDPK